MTEHWLPIRDGDARGLWLWRRHYSRHIYKDGRQPRRWVGPGEQLVLLTVDCQALWVWRKMKDGGGDHQEGVCCSVFRNEGDVLSSILIAEACYWAEQKWPGERQYTYINPRAIKSTNPGFVFKLAGWKQCGITKVNKLLIFERYPTAASHDDGGKRD